MWSVSKTSRALEPDFVWIHGNGGTGVFQQQYDKDIETSTWAVLAFTAPSRTHSSTIQVQDYPNGNSMHMCQVNTMQDIDTHLRKSTKIATSATDATTN